VRKLAGTDGAPNFSDDPAGSFEDRGYGLAGLVSAEQTAHGLAAMPSQYALVENARRAAKGHSREDYARSMGELFATFAAVAQANPFSAAPAPYTAADLIAVTERNRMIAEPYPRLLVARDQVNQGAAVLLASVRAARQFGMDPSQWVYLRGHADLRERNLLERSNIALAPSAPMAVCHALDVARIGLDDITYFDLYSCFPVAVSNVLDALDLGPCDPRGFTLTGGLPYFGGAGNNYSMHAIADAVHRVRAHPGCAALVGANGGVLSKYSVGIYSSEPAPYVDDESALLQRQIDGWSAPERAAHPEGWATVESYTVVHGKRGPTGVVIGRLADGGRRFLAKVAHDADGGPDALLDVLTTASEPIGTGFYVTPLARGNRATLTHRNAVARFRRPAPSLTGRYEFLTTQRDGHLLIVTINRPDVRNALHPPAHEELAQVFDAYFADADLWVAVITGAGTAAFCAGNDLAYSASGKPVHMPLAGFGGLTSRRKMTKPVIAAINGFAMGGGLEIALACHLVVADETATLALSEVKVGLVAGAGGLFRLPRVIPPTIATELILTGRRLGAQEAQQLGLVNRVAPAGEALETARELAAEIMSGSPTSVRLSLAMMEQAEGTGDVIKALDETRPLLDELLVSDDMIEGMTAFVKRRTPVWRNR
jgi:acetyl-CoA C-acetyltransferase